MIHTLIKSFDFSGKKLSEIRLSDYVKAKHNLAYAKVAKLARDYGLPDIRSEIDIEKMSEDDMIKVLTFEAESQQILLESFAEDFPKDALPELSAVDCGAISKHIEAVMDEHKRLHGQPDAAGSPKKKKIRRARSVK
jgi:hypothetical protein